MKVREILRRVRAGQRLTISYWGKLMAEIHDINGARQEEDALRELEEQGVPSRPTAPAGKLEPLARRPAALERALESRSCR